MITTAQTYTAHSSIFQSAIFDAQTFEMIYENEIPCLWEGGKSL
jgi:hypothetical protein